MYVTNIETCSKHRLGLQIPQIPAWSYWGVLERIQSMAATKIRLGLDPSRIGHRTSRGVLWCLITRVMMVVDPLSHVGCKVGMQLIRLVPGMLNLIGIWIILRPSQDLELFLRLGLWVLDSPVRGQTTNTSLWDSFTFGFGLFIYTEYPQTGCYGWLNLSMYLHFLKGVLTNISQMLHGQKANFCELFFAWVRVILKGKGIWWSPFISKGSRSFSSITVQSEPISANEKLHHWSIYWGHCRFLQQMEEWGTCQRTCLKGGALMFYPWTTTTLLYLHNHGEVYLAFV